jgi:hypothetical protein
MRVELNFDVGSDCNVTLGTEGDYSVTLGGRRCAALPTNRLAGYFVTLRPED